jgi:phosphinothricin acetyltransferase
MDDTLILRRARQADAEAIAAIYTSYVRDTVISFESDPPDPAEMTERITSVLGSDLPWIIAGDGQGQVTGYAYATRFHSRHAYRFTVEPTIYLARHACGGGIGTQLYTLLLTILAELGYCQAVARVALPNPASVALHERCGFRQTGTQMGVGLKFGDWIDVALFQRSLCTSADILPEREPLPLGKSACWASLA